MKNYLLLLPFALLPGIDAAAQPTEGQFMLNLAGAGRFFNTGSSPHKHYRFSSQLGGGYFVTDRLALGLQAEMERNIYRPGTSAQLASVGSSSFKEHSLGLMARYYFPMGKKTAFFLHGTAGARDSYYVFEQTNSTTQLIENRKYHNPAVGYAHITPGFAWFPVKRVAVELTALTVGYEHRLQSERYRQKSTFGFPQGLNAKLGVTILLGKGKEKPE